jgi:hypothetical protein
MVKREFCERLVWWDRHPISFADRPCLPLRTQPGLLYLFEPHQVGGGDGQT